MFEICHQGAQNQVSANQEAEIGSGSANQSLTRHVQLNDVIYDVMMTGLGSNQGKSNNKTTNQ